MCEKNDFVECIRYNTYLGCPPKKGKVTARSTKTKRYIGIYVYRLNNVFCSTAVDLSVDDKAMVNRNTVVVIH